MGRHCDEASAAHPEVWIPAPLEASPVADNLRVIAGAEAIIAGHADSSSLGVSAPRDDVLVVVLTRATPYFPQLLTHYSMFPVFSEFAAKSHDSKTWVSNGAYVLSSWTPGGALQLSKNQAYWDRDHVPIANVAYIPLADENAERLRYRAGELDLTQSVPIYFWDVDVAGSNPVTPTTVFIEFSLARLLTVPG
jgi:ABC-type oligopeptide transport system substrate-binding subunit